MPQNQIRLQPGMSLSELIERYGTEAQCEQALEQFRWPDRFVCPACGGWRGHLSLYGGDLAAAAASDGRGAPHTPPCAAQNSAGVRMG